jgi:hypothetical protein
MVTSFLLLALLAAMRLRRKGDAGSYLASGGAAALAIGSLHNGLLAPPALLVAWLRREPRVGRASGAWILAPLLMLAGAIAVFWPFVLARAAPGAPGTASPTSSFLRVFTPDAYRFERVGVFLGEIVQHDPVLVGLAGIGILVLAVTAIRSPDARRAALRGDIAVVLAFAVPYSLALLFLRSTTARYVVAIAPVLAVLGGHVFTLAAGFRRDGGASPRWRVGLAGTGAIVCLVLAFLPVGKLAWIRGRPDTLASGASWLARHAEPGDGIVVVPVYDLPLLPTEAALAKNLEVPWKTPWGEFLARGAWACVDAPAYGVWIQPGVRPEARQALLADPATYFERYRARWVVLATPDYDRVYHAVRAWLTREARLEARFSPLAKDDGRNVHAMYQNDPGDPSAWSVLEFGSLGPTVEIYRLP